MPKDPMFAFRVEPETLDALRNRATTEGRSASSIVRDALREALRAEAEELAQAS